MRELVEYFKTREKAGVVEIASSRSPRGKEYLYLIPPFDWVYEALGAEMSDEVHFLGLLLPA